LRLPERKPRRSDVEEAELPESRRDEVRPALLPEPPHLLPRHLERIEALRNVDWVLNAEGCGYREALKRRLDEAGLAFSVVVEPPDLDLQVQLVRAAVGAGMIPTRALPSPLQRSGLQTFRIPGVTFILDAWLIHRKSGPLVSAVIPLIQRIVVAAVRKRKSAG
jgi:DNA-binding transcriptional LysR family regulator